MIDLVIGIIKVYNNVMNPITARNETKIDSIDMV
jgi:hypothetical protein